MRATHHFLREPLIHFLVIGVGLFVLSAVFETENLSVRANRVIVDESQVQRLAEQFKRTWMRPPTEVELSSLVDEHVKEEILYREALRLGLERDDIVIRRRMRQKMEFLNSDLVELEPPSDEDLQAFLAANADRFREPARFSFRHVYLNPDRPGLSAAKRAQLLLASLDGESKDAFRIDGALAGDPTLLPATLEAATPAEITGTFGQPFAEALAAVPVNRWSGPIPSAYGVHVLLVSQRSPGRLPPLEAIRPTVEREWLAERRTVANNQFYEALRDRYTVEVAMPQGPNADTLATRNR